MFKAKEGTLPVNLVLFSINYDATRQKENFKHKYARTTLKAMCFSVYGVKLWNSLEVKLKECKNVNSFKISYKRMIIESYENKEMEVY